MSFREINPDDQVQSNQGQEPLEIEQIQVDGLNERPSIINTDNNDGPFGDNYQLNSGRPSSPSVTEE